MHKLSLWCLAFLAVLALAISFTACDDDDDDNDDASPIDDDDDNDDASPGDDDDDDDDTWEPIEPHRESYQGWTIVWLAGTPYEMGQQQGRLLHEELAAGIAWLDSYHLLDIVLPLARALGAVEMAREHSYPFVIQECQGLVDAAGDTGWSMDLCLLLNFGDVLIETVNELLPLLQNAHGRPSACTQIIATGPATTDGGLVHGRSLDWSEIEFMLDYPTVFVRQPDGGIPHAFIGFPGNLSPYSGINAAGLSVASDEADPLDRSYLDFTGRSHVQMQAMILKQSHSLAEAREFLEGQNHMSTEIIVVADGAAGEAAVFEMTTKALGVRELADGVVFATNHFVAPETAAHDQDPAGESSTLRYDRVAQLALPGHADSRYGQFDVAAMIAMLRDRVNPYTGEEAPAGTFDNNAGIACNGAIYQIVFDSANLRFWAAGGAIPVPEQPFVGFSLGELLDLPEAVVCEPPVYE